MFRRVMNRLAGDFTEKQGQYLAFIYNYTVMNGRPPAEADLHGNGESYEEELRFLA